MKKICIITTRHISYNPRVLKEADALSGCGYKVTVVTVNNHQLQSKFDHELMQTRSWELKTVNFRKEEANEKRRWVLFSFKQKCFSALSRLTFAWGIAERASLKAYDALLKLATEQKADFYLAHHAEALAVAYSAAKKNKTCFGFDAEDFHSGMNESSHPSKEETLITYLEAKYLPHCSYLSAASKGIGEAYAEKYGVVVNETILNVFPKQSVTIRKSNIPVRFYWYSQVIGPNRSLETLMEASKQLRRPFEIHLRGSFHSEEYKNKLLSLIHEAGLTEKVFFHSPILAEEIIGEAAAYDVGLALESNVSVNRDICVTNKIFSYLMSGLAIVGTDTYGQKDIFAHFSNAVCLCRKNDADDLARAMQYFLDNQENLRLAKAAARIAAEEKFNWERESEKLVTALNRVLNRKGLTKSVLVPEQ